MFGLKKKKTGKKRAKKKKPNMFPLSAHLIEIYWIYITNPFSI